MANFVEKNASVIRSMEEEISREAAVMVNKHQCVEMVEQLHDVSSALVKHQAEILFHPPPGRPPLLLLKEIYRIATIADIIVGECCGRDSASAWGEIRWIEAAVRQLDNQSAFQHVVNELKFCTDLLAKGYRGHPISDIFRGLASKMRAPTRTSFFNDHEQLLSKLRTITCKLDCRKEKLVLYLKHRVDCVVRRAKSNVDNARQSSSSLPSPQRGSSTEDARLSSSSLPSLRRARSNDDARPSSYSSLLLRHRANSRKDEPVALPTPPSETYSYIEDNSSFLETIRTIGEGKDGFVDELKWSDLVCARKSIRTLPRGEFGASEGDIVAGLRHFNVIKIFFQLQYCKNKPRVIMMELMDTSLDTFIKNQHEPGARFSLLAKIDILLQMCYGMQYVHGLGILHLDFKPGNVLVNPCSIAEFAKDGYARVKIADFGSAKVPVFTSSSVDNDCQLPGTTAYRAPEVTGNSNANEHRERSLRCLPERYGTPFRVSKRADVFSWALTCAEVFTGNQPYAGVPQSKIHYLKTRKNERPELPSDLPGSLKSLLVECWSTNPKARPNFEKIVERLLKLKARLLTQDFGPLLHCDSVCVNSPAPLPSLSVKCKAWGALVQKLGKDFSSKLPYNSCKSLQYVTQQDHVTIKYSSGGAKKFAYKDIKLATRGFHPTKKLRQPKLEDVSRYGEMCRADLKTLKKEGCKYGDMYEADIKDSSTGASRLYAVRKIPTTVIDLQALWQMARINHPNIARLLGWCTNSENLLLVYDWVERKDLRTNLQDLIESRHLTWRVRQKILIDVASALRYLHEECGLVHHRVKATNVLLGNDNTAILRDGGLGLLVPQNPHKWDKNSRERHHLAPELPWYKEHTKATDVFGFGILLLEVVCGRRPDLLNDDEMYLADWVWHSFADCYSSKNSLDQWVQRVVDHSSLFGDYDKQEVSVVLCVGLLCCHPDLNARPTMSKVQQVLIDGKGLLDIVYQVPPKKPLVQYGSSTHIDDASFVESTALNPDSDMVVLSQTPFKVINQPKLKLD